VSRFGRWPPGRRAALFVAVALAQLAVPAWMIHGHERTLTHGETFEFEVRPVDPYDPFRGRYVRLALSPDRMPLPEETGGWRMPERDELVYVVLGRDEDGLATFEAVSAEPPDADAYLAVHAWRGADFPPEGETPRPALYIELPFDRYYLNEELAPEAERLVWPRRDTAPGEEETVRARLEVRVYRGRGVPTALLIDGRPVEEVAAP
jgi:uncharacterized membrane-anchored protein